MSQSYFPLSISQRNIFNQELKFNNTPINNICTTLNIRGRVDFNLLQNIINQILELDDSFRTRFSDQEPVLQYIHPYQSHIFPIFDFSLTNQEGIDQWTSTISRELMPLYDTDMYQFYLYKTEEMQGGVLIKTHHLISDGYTQVLLCNRIAEMYLKHVHEEEMIDPIIFSYQQHIEKEKQYLESKAYQRNQQYWTDITQKMPLAQSVKECNSASLTYIGKRLTFSLSEKQNHLVYQYCLKERISPFSLFYMALAIWLKRARNIDQFTIGVPILNRSDYSDKNTSGMFVSTLPFYARIDENWNINEFNQYLMIEWLNLLKNQKFPYSDIYQLAKQANSEHRELFYIVLSYQSSLAYQVESTQVYFDGRWNYSGYQGQHLLIHVSNRMDQQRYTIDYDYLVQIFSQQEIIDLHEMLMTIIQDALTNQDKPIWTLAFLSDKIENQVLYHNNQQDQRYRNFTSMKELLFDIAKNNPQKIALIHQGQRLSYQRLMCYANEVTFLFDQDDKPIMLILPRSHDLIIAMVACILVNRPWILIDSNTPVNRIEEIIKDADVKLIISNQALSLSVEIKAFPNKLSGCLITDLIKSDLNQVSYIVYTSGTSGKPKGVRVKELSLLNFARCSSNLYGHQAVLSLCNIGFDAFILESIVSLLNKQTIVLADDDKVNDPNYLTALINDHAVGFLAMTPSRLSAFMQNRTFCQTLARMETIICGGEIFPSELLQRIKQFSNAKIINQYGPSEATIGVSYKELNNARFISVGKPMVGCRLYVLDDHLLPLPINAVGEIFIAGVCLADGYQNNPEQTDEVFINNPFEPNELMYRSKDLGFWNKEGDLVIVGRSDDQIKLHGYRIELQEIATRLQAHQMISEATAIIDLINGVEVIIAYYVASETIKDSMLRTFLAAYLPYYMLPHYFIKIDELPLSANGKVDQQRLIRPNITYTEVAPTSQLENRLLSLFKNNLKKDDFTIISDYFLSGGDSLKAIELLSEINNKLSFNLSIIDLYTLKTIKAIAEHLGDEVSLKTPITYEKNNDEHYPLTTIQNNLYVLQSMDNSTAYNMPGYIKLDKPIDIKRFNDAFNTLLKDEPVLRSSFVLSKTSISAKINECKLKIETVSYDDLNQALASFIKPFNLDKAPLIRVTYALIKEEYYLLIDIHHIIMDGISTPLLLRKLLAIYDHKPFNAPTITYPDYALAQGKINVDKQQLAYWKQTLNDVITPLTFLKNPYAKRLESKACRLELNLDMTNDQLSNLAAKYDTTIFNLLVATFGLLIGRYHDQTHLCIGTVTSGRNKPHTQDMIGVFINTLPLIIDYDLDQQLDHYLANVTSNMIELLANQDVGLDQILAHLNENRENRVNQLYNIIFSFRPFVNEGFMIDDQTVTLQSAINPSLKMPLVVDVYRFENGYKVQYDFDQAEFTHETIAYYHDSYKLMLNSLDAYQDQKISSIPLVSKQIHYELIEKPFYQYYPYHKQPLDMTILHQAKLIPDETAIIFKDMSITYATLYQRVDSLAANLLKQNIKPRSTIAIALKRGFELLITMLAINRIGCCYVPLDLDFPDERLNHMLLLSNCSLIISQNNLLQERQLAITNIFDYDDQINLSVNNTIERSINDSMYILFTSGSTGKPKGVELPFKALANLYQALGFVFDDVKTVLCSTNPVFDVFITESLLALAYGKTVVMADETEMMYPWQMADLITKYNIDLVQYTPSRCQLCVNNSTFYEALSNVRSMILVGEALSVNLLNRLKQSGNINILNFYGPTEAAVYVSYVNLKHADSVTIGKPLRNCRVYVLDDKRKLLPPLKAGELYLAGECLAKGYVNQEDATASVFVSDIIDKEERMYKTGDYGYIDLNGDIVFISRIDSQIKLDGHRIEINEIKEILLHHEMINDALIIPIIENDMVSYLHAYLVSDLTEDEVRSYLKTSLPPYMVPSKISLVKMIPLTASGKSDVNKLKQENTSVTCTTQDSLYDQIKLLWQDVLNKNDINDDLSFFEQGGTSLKALLLINGYYEMQQQMTMKDFYDNPTLTKQLQLLNGTKPIASEQQANKHRHYVPTSKKLSFHNKVLLTGATGFLGSHLLYELCKQDRMIYCLIRDKVKFEQIISYYFSATWYQENKSKIILIVGDITLPMFGLNEAMYYHLANNIGEIINCAANVNHFGDQAKILKVNHIGTENLLALAHANEMSFHQISTTGISGDAIVNNELNITNFDEHCFDVGQNWMDNIYIKSKFLAETAVYQKIDEGLKAHVYRVGHLINRQNDGVFQFDPNNNEIYRVMQGLKAINGIPVILADLMLELTPVDKCAEAIMKLMYSDITNYHIYNPNLIALTSCLDNLSVIEMAEYRQRLATIDLQKQPYVADVTATITRFEKAKVSYQISNNETIKKLDEQSFTFDVINKNMLFK